MSEIIIQKVFLEIPYEHINFAKENKLLWAPEEKKWTIQKNHPCFKSICHKYEGVNLKVSFADKDISNRKLPDTTRIHFLKMFHGMPGMGRANFLLSENYNFMKIKKVWNIEISRQGLS